MDPPTTDHSDREDRWIEGLQAADPSVFEEIFRTLYEDLVAYVQTIVHREDIAEGLVQDVFVRVWNGEKDWSDSDRVTAYLYRSVHNRALNVVRDRRRNQEQKAEFADNATSPYVPADRQLQVDEVRQQIEETIDALPARQQQVFLLSRRHDLTYAEIADVLDISERTVETHIRRALQKLRACLAQKE